MRRFSVLAVLWLVPVMAEAERWPQVEPEAIRAHVAFLADDLLEGRATGSRGHELAALYVATQLQLLGAAPAGAGGSWLQPVPLVEARRVVDAARAVITRQGDAVELIPAVDFVPLPGHLAGDVSVEAPLVFAGFGLSAPELGYDDFSGIDVAGKVAVILNGLPPAVPSHRRDYYNKQKARQLDERGAVGIVQVITPTEAERTPWERTVAMTRVASLRLLDAEGRPRDSYRPFEAGIVLNSESAAKLFAGAPRSFEQIWAEAGAGRTPVFDLPASISITTRSTLQPIRSANVVGMLEGSDPQLRREYVVLMAHLDHIGQGAAVNGDSIYNGALDNASGVAVLLETARALVAASQRPRRSILFLAVTAEERGLLGSRHFAVSPTVPQGSIVAVVNLDMPVALYPAAGYTVIGAEHSSLGEIARGALAAEGLQVLPNQAPERGLFTYTDQYSFVREGIPALYLHDGPVSADPRVDAKQVFDGYLRHHYHQVSDEIDLPIDWASLAGLARVQARLCRDIADARERPYWLPGDFYGEMFGRK